MGSVNSAESCRPVYSADTNVIVTSAAVPDQPGNLDNVQRASAIKRRQENAPIGMSQRATRSTRHRTRGSSRGLARRRTAFVGSPTCSESLRQAVTYSTVEIRRNGGDVAGVKSLS